MQNVTVFEETTLNSIRVGLDSQNLGPAQIAQIDGSLYVFLLNEPKFSFWVGEAANAITKALGCAVTIRQYDLLSAAERAQLAQIAVAV